MRWATEVRSLVGGGFGFRRGAGRCCAGSAGMSLRSRSHCNAAVLSQLRSRCTSWIAPPDSPASKSRQRPVERFSANDPRGAPTQFRPVRTGVGSARRATRWPPAGQWLPSQTLSIGIVIGGASVPRRSRISARIQTLGIRSFAAAAVQMASFSAGVTLTMIPAVRGLDVVSYSRCNLYATDYLRNVHDTVTTCNVQVVRFASHKSSGWFRPSCYSRSRNTLLVTW